MGKFCYAVARGHKVGIYENWNQCKIQVNGFQGARFKKFETRVEAEQFIADNCAKDATVATPGPGSQKLLGKRKRTPSTSAIPANKTREIEKKNPIPDGLPVIYTDGACSHNGAKHAKAGWGVYWGPGHEDNCCGPVTGAATNNRGELEAVKVALSQSITKELPAVVIRTDSMLLINSLDKWINEWKRNGWKTRGGPVKNPDLLQDIDAQRKKIKVYFEHVAGHAGIEGNEAADELARAGAQQYKKNSTH